MSERFDSSDNGREAAAQKDSLPNPFTMEDILPSTLTLNPFKKKKEAKEDSFDTLTLNPFEKDKSEAHPKRFLNPFEEDDDKQGSAKDKTPNLRRFHRPSLPEKVDGAEAYVVKPGDSPWKIAHDLLKSRTGHDPSAGEVDALSKGIAKLMGESDPASILLYPGDKIFVPLTGQDSKQLKTPYVETSQEIVGAQNADGTSWQKQDDGKWHLMDKDNKPVPKPGGGQVTADSLEDGLKRSEASAAQGSQAKDSGTKCSADCPSTPGESKDNCGDVQKVRTPSDPKNFDPNGDVYSPVRPPGIGEMKAGEFSDDDQGKGIDWRKCVPTRREGDDNTTYSYSGELEGEKSGEWGNWWPGNWGDTNFTAEERVGKDGSIVGTTVTYDSPVYIKFKNFDGGALEIPKVTKVETTRQDRDGDYVTLVTTDDGSQHHFVTAADGTVKNYWSGN